MYLHISDFSVAVHISLTRSSIYLGWKQVNRELNVLGTGQVGEIPIYTFPVEEFIFLAINVIKLHTEEKERKGKSGPT
jgi:hypothetical protein